MASQWSDWVVLAAVAGCAQLSPHVSVGHATQHSCCSNGLLQRLKPCLADGAILCGANGHCKLLCNPATTPNVPGVPCSELPIAPVGTTVIPQTGTSQPQEGWAEEGPGCR